MADARGRLRRTSTASSSTSTASRRRLRRAPSTASAVSAGRESASAASLRGSVRPSEFDAFLSDSSSDEDEEDADARAIARMQQLDDDRAYLPDGSESLMFHLDSPNGEDVAGGFLPLQVDEEEEEGVNDSFAGPSTAVQRQEQEQDASFAGSDMRPSADEGDAGANDSFTDNSLVDNSFADNSFADNSFADNSFADNSFADNSFAGNSFAGNLDAGNSFTDNSFTDNSFTDNSFAERRKEQDVSFTGSDLRPSVEDAGKELGASMIGASNNVYRASDEQSEESDVDDDGDYIEENDDSFVAVHRPAFDDDDDDDDGSDEDESGRQTQMMRATSAFEAAATDAFNEVREEEQQGVIADDDKCVTVTIDDDPLTHVTDAMPQLPHREQEERANETFAVAAALEHDNSFSGMANPEQDPFLSVNDSFIGDHRGSSGAADQSFLEDKPRPTFGSAGKGSFGDPFLRVNDSFIGDQRGSGGSFGDQRGSGGSFGDPFLRVNDSFIGAHRSSADSADRSFLEAKPRPTIGSTGSGSFSEDIDASFRLDAYGDSFGSAHNDSYVADHAPCADNQLSERVPDSTAGSVDINSSRGDPKRGECEVVQQDPDTSKSSFMSANLTPQGSKDGSIPTQTASSSQDPPTLPAVLNISVTGPSGDGQEMVLPTNAKQETSCSDNTDQASRSNGVPDRDGQSTPVAGDSSAANAEMERIRFSRVPSSIPRDSSRPIDFRDTQHRFDEEIVHHADPLSPAYRQDKSVADDVPGFRENSFSNSLSSSAASFSNKDGNFFVSSDRGSDARSYSNSISDSFASMVILGDTALDANSFVGSARQSDMSAGAENAESLDRSYSSLIDRQKIKSPPQPQATSSQKEATSTQQPSASRSSGAGSVLSLSSASVSSSVATDDELSFVSFNGGIPPAAPAPGLASSKSSASSSGNRSQSSSPSFFLGNSNGTVRHADSFIRNQQPSDCASGIRDPSRSQAGSFVDVSFASSIDDSQIFPDARTRGDTRSDEIEAGDIVQGVLPSVPPPLKIGLATASPATSALSGISSSFGSIGGSDVVRNTDDKLDFTGVYRGSVNSLESSGVATGQAGRRAPASADVGTAAVEKPEPAALPAVPSSASAVRLARSVSDKVQRESQRKVEDFFRRTYQYQNGDADIDGIDDDIRWTTKNRATRSRTTVIYCVDEFEEEREQAGRNRSSTIATTKIIDLKNLKGGHKLYQKVLTPQRESEDVGAYVAENTPGEARARRGSRFYTNDLTGDSIEPVSMKLPSDTSYYANLGKDANGMKPLEVEVAPRRNVNAYAAPVNYELSPKTSDSQAKSSNFLAASGATVKRLGGFGANRRADNASLMSLTPSQPRISMDSSSYAPSPYTVAMLAKSPGMSKWQQEHPSSRDLGLSPGSSVSVKESMFRPTGLSRPTFSEQVASHVHHFSSSLTNTIRRAGAALFGQSLVKHQGENGPTSPQSTCPAPPRLARGFDERDFYARFARCGGVEDPDGPPIKPIEPLSNRQWKRRNSRLLRMAVAAIVGLVLGIVLTQVGGLDDVFGLDATEVHEQQRFNGELVLPMATQWILFPGRLFLRVWNCVVIPLLFCHVANGVADVVMGEKGSSVLSFRTFGVMLLVSVITTLEGIGAMAITNSAGWFQTSDAVKVSTMAAAQSLVQTLGTAVYADGAVGLLCSSNHEYLQQLDNTQFNCSNVSIALPVYEGASGNGTIQGSGAAIFALHELTNMLSTMESNASASAARYYPEGLTVSEALGGLFEAAVPGNSAASFVHSSPLAVVAVGVVVGLFCGKRAYRRLLAIKAAMDNSTRSYNTRSAMAAEQNAQQPHYVLGILVELQLALEWILERLETYVAPVGVVSLLAGNMVAHYQEWQTIVTPMMQLIVGVLVVCLVHVIVVMPVLMKICFKTNVFTTLTVPFIPSFLFTFYSGSVTLTSPVTVRCFSDARIITKSSGQVMASLAGVLHRSGHGLYFPLALLWLMETNTLSANASSLNFDGSSYLFISGLILCSCFAALSPSSIVSSGLSSRGNLAIMMTLWRAVVSQSTNDASVALAVPPTFPLLVLCDVILSRLIDIVNVYGTLIATFVAADYCDEVVVEASEVSNSVLSPVYL